MGEQPLSGERCDCGTCGGWPVEYVLRGDGWVSHLPMYFLYPSAEEADAPNPTPEE